MSAIPNLPESLLREHPQDAALHQFKHTEDSVSHIEHAEMENHKTENHTETETNGNHANGVKQEWMLHDSPIENQRPIRVIVIGAGYSGIYLGIRIPERIRNCDLTIYEKNDGLGGTWYENRYEGAACDVPSHSYQFSFNPKHDWSSLYAPSSEIRDYLQSTAKKFSVDRYVKLQHEVKDCRWDQEQGKWHVKVQRPDGSVFDDSCDMLVSARGLLNNIQWPTIDGLRSFEGELMHSATWNEKYDWTNKRVAVIGSGSSAIQIIPRLQKKPGATLNCFIRSRTWISPPLGQKVADDYGLKNVEFTPEQIQKFKDDPEAWNSFRLRVEYDANNIHGVTLKGTEMQKGAQALFEEGMKERLKKKPELFDMLRPGFAPGCRRLTPGPGFLEALVEPNVNFIRDRISRIEPKGVVTDDGKLHEVDALVCATGFYASSAPPFKVTGLNGHTLQEHWADRATNYLSLTTDQFPNHFLMLGPNGAIGEGSLTMMIESTGDYILKAIRKLQKDNIKSMIVKPARVKDFNNYCDTYFKGTVFVDKCQSWYKKNGRGESGDIVTGLWPGSTLHCIEALRSPRWEDYEYEYIPEPNGAEVNAMGWLGNGWGVTQLNDPPREQDLGFYLMPMFQERDIGIPQAPRPEENEQYITRPWSY